MAANNQREVEITMKGSSARTIGLLAIIIGICIFIGIVFYMLSFRIFDRVALLAIGAFIIAIGALLNIMLAWRLYLNIHPQPPWFSQLVLLTGMIGSFIVFIGSTLDLLSAIFGHSFDMFPLSQTRSIIVIGFAFIGLWLLLLNYHARLHDAWSNRLAWLGIIAGIIMAMGLLAVPRIFVPYVSLYHKPAPEIGELLGNLGWMLFYPIWSIWFGCLVLSDGLKVK